MRSRALTAFSKRINPDTFVDECFRWRESPLVREHVREPSRPRPLPELLQTSSAATRATGSRPHPGAGAPRGARTHRATAAYPREDPDGGGTRSRVTAAPRADRQELPNLNNLAQM